MQAKTYSEADVVDLLNRHGVGPTTQRVRVAQLLLTHCTHMAAEDVYRLVNTGGQYVSKATVYNTLGLLAEKGLVREVIADPNRIFYDPNARPHHHFYDVDSGKLSDIDANGVEITGLPNLPSGTRLEGIDVIVRLRSIRQENF